MWVTAKLSFEAGEPWAAVERMPHQASTPAPITELPSSIWRRVTGGRERVELVTSAIVQAGQGAALCRSRLAFGQRGCPWYRQSYEDRTTRVIEQIPGVSSPTGSGPALASVVLDDRWAHLCDGAFVVKNEERQVKPFAVDPSRELRLWDATAELPNSTR